MACPFEEVGRVLAGNLTLPSGTALPVIVVHSPSGASSRVFDSSTERVADGWCFGLDLCLAKSWYPVEVGDFNSLVVVALSACLGSSFVLRPSSCSCFCSRRPPEACGEGSNDVSGADLRSAGGGCAGGPRLLL